MKVAGLLLMLAGWAIALTAVALLAAAAAKGAFVLAGIAIEMLGLALLGRSHLPARNVRTDA